MLRSILRLSASAVMAGLLATALLPGGSANAQTRCGSQVTVAPGDTLFRIAERCGTTVAAILAINPQITNPNVIHAGQSLRLAPGQLAGVAPPPRFLAPPAAGTYVVRPGDTLYRISVRIGVPLALLLAANPHIDPRFMRPGLVIRLPGERPREVRDGRITVTGVITREGVRCPALRGSDGRLYTLAGDIGSFQPGDRVQVRGRRAEASICMQGTTITVERIRALGPQTGDGLITVTGVVTREGVECPAIRGADGRLYTLAGDVGALEPGERVQVQGRRAEVSICMQGTTISVERLRRLG